jgi:hypothetical protein
LPGRLLSDLAVQPHWQKYLAFAVGQIKSSTVAVSSHRGALAIVTTAGRDAVDARARRKPLKPLRGECRVFRCDRGDYARMLFYFACEAAGRIERPAFPAPSDVSDALHQQDSRACRGEIAKVCSSSLLREAWGGWLAEGQSGGGCCQIEHFAQFSCAIPHPALRATLRASFARLDPTRGRDQGDVTARAQTRVSFEYVRSLTLQKPS